METTDPNLSSAYRTLAQTNGNFYGLSILTYKHSIRKLIKRFEPTSLLDYGSGRGDAYKDPELLHKFWGVDAPTLYDPAFETHDQKPEGKFDGVICSDVLEHVPIELVPNFIEELFAYANKFVWASVCCRSAKKFFPDGRNLHLTIMRFDWWERQFQAAAAKHPGIGWVLKETE